jgi:NAD+ diphosphatase
MPTPTVNVYAGPYVDRASDRRKDPSWLAAALDDASTRFVPVWRSRSLVRIATAPGTAPGAVLLTRESFVEFDPAGAILLGQFHGHPVFAVELDSPEPPPLADAAEFADLRTAGALLPADEAGLLAYARALVYWRHRHRWCGTCGEATAPASAGHVMRCTACGTDYFPRIDPAIIVLISDGERALLGRQAAWPPGRYSTIAGFVEPGESLEDAVIREVHEETGARVLDVAYHSSQPWPFPSSLMIGFLATASGADPVVRHDAELEDARWFTRAEIASGAVGLPPPQSISFRLIAEWYDRAAPRPLVEEPGVRTWTVRR